MHPCTDNPCQVQCHNDKESILDFKHAPRTEVPKSPMSKIPDAAAKVLFATHDTWGILDTGATKTVMGSDFVPGFYKMFMSVSEARFAGAPVM